MIADKAAFRRIAESDNYAGAAAHDPARLYRPLSLSNVPAGFPSPADDYIASQLDLNEYFVAHPSASFYWKVSGESMNLAGILDGAILLIDRSLQAAHKDVVLATINGDVTVKRFIRTGSHIELRPESTRTDYKTLRFTHADEVEIWGVVSAVFHKFK